MLARLAALEAEVGGRDEQAARAGLEARIAALETAGEAPVAALSGQLAALHAQKDAGLEAMLARLGPLEAKLAELEAGLGRLDPAPALDRVGERLEAARGVLQAQIDALQPGENPFAEISGQLTQLYAQKDAAVEAVLDPARRDRGGAGRARPAPALARLDARPRGVARAAGRARGAGRQPLRGDLGATDAALRPEGRGGGGGLRPAGAAGGEAGRARGSLGRMARAGLDRFAERLEEPAAAGADRRAGGRGEPVRGDLGAADAALRPEGRDGGDGVRPARAAGGEARRARGGLGRLDPRGRWTASRAAGGPGPTLQSRIEVSAPRRTRSRRSRSS